MSTATRLSVATLAVVLLATSCGVSVVPPEERTVTISTAGCGYATEAVGRNVAFAFDEVGTAKTMKTLPEIVRADS